MATVESTPAILDFETLLQPISEERPAGENLQYSGIYDEIREARRADHNLAQGQWQHELKVADFRRVIELAIPALEKQTKDLQIAAWLAEALTREKSFAGLRDSLRLMCGFHEIFWETCFPEIDEGDQEARANALEWLDKQAALAAREAPITAGENLSFVAWEESKRFDIPENIETLEFNDQEKYRELKAEAEQFKKITGERWRKAKSASRRQFYEELSLTLEECQAEFDNLDRAMEEKFDRNQMPGLTNLKKALDDIRGGVKKLLQEKRELEPDAADATGATNGESEIIAADGTVTTVMAAATGAIRSRQDALRRLAEVADFFRQTEPHSPVAYLVQRAVKWGNMPLESWLQDVIKDEGVLGQLREMLGLDTGANSSETYPAQPAESAQTPTDSW